MKHISCIQQVLFFLLFATLPFSQMKLSFFSVPLYLPEIIVLLLTVSFLVRFPRERVFPRRYFLWGVILFVGGAALSLSLNPFSLTGLGMLKSWFIFPSLLAFFLYFFLLDEEKEEGVLWMWFLMNGGVLLVALFFLFQNTLTYDGRLQAFYTSPNFLALTLAPSVLIGVYFLFQGQMSKIVRVCISGMMPLLFLVLFMTHSYGTWLALFISLLVFTFTFTWRSMGKYHCALLVGLLLVIGTFFVLEQGSEKWQSLVSFEERSSLSSRFMIWRASAAILEDHLFLGIGVGRFQEVYLAYQPLFPPYLEWAVPQPHNFYIALLLQTGLLGFTGFIFILGGYFTALRQAWTQTHTSRSFLSLCLSLMLFYLLYGLFDTPYFKTDLAYTFWILLALGIGVASRMKKAS